MANQTSGLGAVLIILGITILIAGLAFWAAEKGHIKLDRWRLPGDLQFRRGTLFIWIPLGTSLLLSIVLTVLINLFRHR